MKFESNAGSGKESQAAHKDWTIAVDLGTSFPPDRDNPNGGGVDREVAALQKMAGETKDKSVNIIVHAERPVDKEGGPCADQPDVDKAGACVFDAVDKKQAITERYFIHDGEIDRLPDAKYGSPAEDLQNLVSEAGQMSASEKLGLISLMHGGGSWGVRSNLGHANLDQVIGALRTGLKATGHEKLDLLDYDSCNMADAVVLENSSSVAKNVVASSGVETYTDTNDCQNLPATLRALLTDTKMSGTQLGNKIVELDKQGLDGSGYNNGVRTIANFDMSYFNSFRQDLDAFGSALSVASRNTFSLEQIKADIEKTAKPNLGVIEPFQNERSLKDFAQHILADSEAGRFHSDSAPLKQAAQNMLRSLDSLTTDSYGDPEKGDGSVSGLSVYLPGKEVLDSEQLAKGLEPLRAMQSYLLQQIDGVPKPGDRGLIVRDARRYLGNLNPQVHRKFQGEVAHIDDAIDAIAKASDQVSFRSALQNLLSTAKSASDGPLGRDSLYWFNGSASRSLILNKPFARTGTHWDDFVQKLRQQISW